MTNKTNAEEEMREQVRLAREALANARSSASGYPDEARIFVDVARSHIQLAELAARHYPTKTR